MPTFPITRLVWVRPLFKPITSLSRPSKLQYMLAESDHVRQLPINQNYRDEKGTCISLHLASFCFLCLCLLRSRRHNFPRNVINRGEALIRGSIRGMLLHGLARTSSHRDWRHPCDSVQNDTRMERVNAQEFLTTLGY